MTTDKKHIAVYLAPEIEQALISFCEQRGLKSKKGTMFSAGVNAALAEFFGISHTKESSIPQYISNIRNDIGNTLQSGSNIPNDIGNIPLLPLVPLVEELPGKQRA
ncbi:hypothetical protein QUA42_25740 [Microcoleus sp. Pol11C2]|uniref:hypothetical protein n=1 Tax=Microcoleus sp. Pol11C2 TaxID=3055389 RepID=UPI002FCF9E42